MGHARKTAAGDAQTFLSRRDLAVQHFNKLGIDAERVCAAVDRKSVDDLTADDLLTLRGMANAIKDGAATLDESFPKIDKEAPKSAADKLKEKIETQKAKDAPKPGPDGKSETIATEAGKPKAESKRTGDTKPADTKPAAAKTEKPKAAAKIEDSDIDSVLSEAADIERDSRDDGDEDLGFEN
jgi:hypothetical protein